PSIFPSTRTSSLRSSHWGGTENEKRSPVTSTLEIGRALVGSFVGQFGSARPISKVEGTGDRFSFSVPPQWEDRTDDVRVRGKIEGGSLRGHTTDDKGRRVEWTGRRAPVLKREKAPEWGKSIELFNRKDLTGWQARHKGAKNGWVVRDGLLVNDAPGNDLMTE